MAMAWRDGLRTAMEQDRRVENEVQTGHVDVTHVHMESFRVSPQRTCATNCFRTTSLTNKKKRCVLGGWRGGHSDSHVCGTPINGLIVP